MAAFKALKYWWANAHPSEINNLDLLLPTQTHKYNQYSGAPIPDSEEKK